MDSMASGKGGLSLRRHKKAANTKDDQDAEQEIKKGIEHYNILSDVRTAYPMRVS